MVPVLWVLQLLLAQTLVLQRLQCSQPREAGWRSRPGAPWRESGYGE